MYCGKCGAQMADGAVFCPKCGQKTEKTTGKTAVPPVVKPVVSPVGVQADIRQAGQGMRNPSVGTDSNIRQRKNPVRMSRIVIVFLVLIAILAIWKFFPDIKEKISPSLAGTWVSEDVLDMSNIVRELLIQEGGVPEEIVDTIMGGVGADVISNASITFGEDGSLRFTGSGLSVNIGSFTYEKISKDTLLLNYSINIPIIGDVSASYQAKYTLKKDNLTIDLFGVTARFKRQE